MKLEQDTRFSDLTVTFSGQSLKVHKVQLYYYSDWFKTALDSDFQEGDSNNITLADDDPVALRAMFEHCYSQDYEKLESRCDEARKLLFDAKVLLVADKYQANSLLHVVRKKTKAALRLSVAELHQQGLLEALDFLYGNLTNSSCSDLLTWIPKYLGSKIFDLVGDEGFDQLLQKHGKLSYACARVMKESKPYGLTICPDCKASFTIVNHVKSSAGPQKRCPYCAGLAYACSDKALSEDKKGLAKVFVSLA